MGSLEDDRVSIIPNEEGNVVAIQSLLAFCFVCIVFKKKLDIIFQLFYKQPASFHFYGKTSSFLLF